MALFCTRVYPRVNTILGTALHVLAIFSIATVSAHEPHPMAMHELDWSAQNIKRVNAMAEDFQSGELTLIWTLPGRVEQVEGRACLVGPYFIFDVDDEFAFDIDETVTVELEFDRSASDGFVISYDHASDAPVSKRVVFESGDSTRWHKESVTLDRAGFANRRHGYTDLGIAALGTEIIYDAESDHEIVLCDIKIKRDKPVADAPHVRGTLSLQILDASSAPTAARVGIYDQRGRMPLPGAQAVTVRRFKDRVKQLPVRRGYEFWPAKGRNAFYVNGSYEASLPAQGYELVASKGPEYSIHRQQFAVGADLETSLEIPLRRWIDMPAKGWYSGDVHIHIEREREANAAIAAQLNAEDLHVSNLLQMSNPARFYFPQYAFGVEGHYGEDDFWLIPGQESPRTAHRGHTISLNVSRYHDPGEYFLYHQTAAAVQADGGLFGYAHVMMDAFHASWGLALDVPMGLVNFVEVLQISSLGTEILYDFWNLGFNIVPVAGSDYPYINLPGTERSYVHIDGEFSPQSWFDELKLGKTFVSNAPMLSLSANDKTMGETLKIAVGKTVLVQADAKVNPDFDSLVRLEVVLHGEVVASAHSERGSEVLSLNHELTPVESCWIAVRAYGKDGALAHSAPVFVAVGGVEEFWNRAAVPRLVEKYKQKVRQLTDSVPETYQDLEKWETSELVEAAWRTQLPALQERAEVVLQRYDDLLKRAGPNGVRD
jgi:hypothetical protein